MDQSGLVNGVRLETCFLRLFGKGEDSDGRGTGGVFCDMGQARRCQI